jgi:hypothetical protein
LRLVPYRLSVSAENFAGTMTRFRGDCDASRKAHRYPAVRVFEPMTRFKGDFHRGAPSAKRYALSGRNPRPAQRGLRLSLTAGTVGIETCSKR